MQVTRVAPGWPVPSLMHRRRVMADRITYVGLDVHKDSIVVAVAAGGLRGEVREYGRIANTPTALDRLLRKHEARHRPTRRNPRYLHTGRPVLRRTCGLEGVMNNSEQYHQPVLEALSAFVRDGTRTDTGDGPPTTDIQAALTVIGRRKSES